MIVRVHILFESAGDADLAAVRFLALDFTNSPDGVRVFPDVKPGWLVVEFPMPTEAQYQAVPKIDRAIRFRADRRLDSAIGFPKSDAERARAKRKAERRRNRRRRVP